jgi:hypothetical protein
MYKGLRAVGGEAQRQGLFDLSVGINSTAPSGLVYRVNPTLRKCQDVTRLVCSVYRGFNHLAKVVVVVGLVPTGTLFHMHPIPVHYFRSGVHRALVKSSDRFTGNSLPFGTLDCKSLWKKSFC